MRRNTSSSLRFFLVAYASVRALRKIRTFLVLLASPPFTANGSTGVARSNKPKQKKHSVNPSVFLLRQMKLLLVLLHRFAVWHRDFHRNNKEY